MYNIILIIYNIIIICTYINTELFWVLEETFQIHRMPGSYKVLPTCDMVVSSLFTINRWIKLMGATFQAQLKCLLFPEALAESGVVPPCPEQPKEAPVPPLQPSQLPFAFNDLWVNPSLPEAMPSWRSVATHPPFPLWPRAWHKVRIPLSKGKVWFMKN